MSRKKKVVRNIIILIVLSILTFTRGIYLTPIAAHEASERSIHYGPSKVVHIEDFDGGKYILCKYDKWISCNTINRTMYFFWTFGNQVTGIEVDKEKPLNFTWSHSNDRYKIYGIINDNNINRVELHLEDGTTLSQTKFYDDNMFLFTWEGESGIGDVKAYDSQGNILFEDYR
jgi:hypothetical protein